MAILYQFRGNNVPTNLNMFPPSVLESDWFVNISEANTKLAVSTDHQTLIIFKDVAELTEYLNNNRLTDSALIADIEAWKSAHDITYDTFYFNLDTASIAPTPTPIIS